MRAPQIVHKTYNGDNRPTPAPYFAEEQPPFTEEQVDIVAGALAGLRQEFRELIAAEVTRLERTIAELRDADSVRSEISELRGALSTLLNKSADGSRSLELSATEVVRRERRVRTRKT